MARYDKPNVRVGQERPSGPFEGLRGQHEIGSGPVMNLPSPPTIRLKFATAVGVLRYVWGHPANVGRRRQAVLHAISYQVQARLLHRRVLARLGERSRLFVDLHRTSASKALYANPPDMPEMLAWRRVLRNGGLFIDVGANVGTYTIWAAELGAEVIALEPAAETFALLSENIKLNGYEVTTVQAAAGDHCGTVRFTTNRDSVNCVDQAGPAEVRLVTIDSLIGDTYVAGMKVDVEGFEIHVLRGCLRALSEHRIGLIQLEWNEASRIAVGADRCAVADLLTEHGYRLFRPDQAGRLFPITHHGFGADVFARP
jgi:FkbM family methyltransferase